MVTACGPQSSAGYTRAGSQPTALPRQLGRRMERRLLGMCVLLWWVNTKHAKEATRLHNRKRKAQSRSSRSTPAPAGRGRLVQHKVDKTVPEGRPIGQWQPTAAQVLAATAGEGLSTSVQSKLDQRVQSPSACQRNMRQAPRRKVADAIPVCLGRAMLPAQGGRNATTDTANSPHVPTHPGLEPQARVAQHCRQVTWLL